MLYVLPDYYREFHCTAGDCEETCCAGWQIVIDEQSLKRYRSYRGPFLRRLLVSVDWRNKMFRQDREKRCAFLNEQNLCQMYQNMGADSLCRTCKLYPRHIEEFEGVREISLSVSCPEAARILLNRENPVAFREFYREKEECYEEFDELLYSCLADCRKVMIGILQDRTLPLRIRCGLITGLANDMQKRYMEGKLFSCQELFQTAETQKARRITERRLTDGCSRRFDWICTMFGELERLECLKEDWPLWLAEVRDLLYRDGEKAYLQTEKEFLDWLEKDGKDWQIPFEQLLVYFTFSYFCGAVYDGEILASAQLGVVHVWLIREMLMAVWLRNGREISIEDMTDLVCRYSRELEHSDLNQKQMEKLMTQYRLPWLQKTPPAKRRISRQGDRNVS